MNELALVILVFAVLLAAGSAIAIAVVHGMLWLMDWLEALFYMPDKDKENYRCILDELEEYKRMKREEAAAQKQSTSWKRLQEKLQ